MNADLSRWLDQTTRELPADIRDAVRDELEAHYGLAYADALRAEGNGLLAHAVAMTELGDVGAATRALREVHRAKRYYRLAIVACLGYAAFSHGLLPFIYDSSTYSPAMCSVILFASMALLIRGFQVMTRQHYLLESHLRTNTWLLLGGLFAVVLMWAVGGAVDSMLGAPRELIWGRLHLAESVIFGVAIALFSNRVLWLRRKYFAMKEAALGGIILGVLLLLRAHAFAMNMLATEQLIIELVHMFQTVLMLLWGGVFIAATRRDGAPPQAV